MLIIIFKIAATKTARKPAAKAARKPAAKAARRPAAKATKTARRPAAKTARKPAAKTARKPAAKTTARRGRKWFVHLCVRIITLTNSYTFKLNVFISSKVRVSFFESFASPTPLHLINHHAFTCFWSSPYLAFISNWFGLISLIITHTGAVQLCCHEVVCSWKNNFLIRHFKIKMKLTDYQSLRQTLKIRCDFTSQFTRKPSE